MQSLKTQCANVCPGVHNERGQDQIAAAVELIRQDQAFGTKKCRAPSGRVRQFGKPLVGESGLWTVSTLWVTDWAVPRPESAGFCMFQRKSSVCKG